MGVNHGQWEGRVPENLEWGDANANCFFRFCHVSKFRAPDCLHYSAVKSLPTRWLWQRIHYFSKLCQKYIFCVHQITTSGGKFNMFLARARTAITAHNLPKHAISSEKKTFLRGGSGLDPLSKLCRSEDGYPSHTPSLLDLLLRQLRIPARFTPLVSVEGLYFPNGVACAVGRLYVCLCVCLYVSLCVLCLYVVLMYCVWTPEQIELVSGVRISTEDRQFVLEDLSTEINYSAFPSVLLLLKCVCDQLILLHLLHALCVLDNVVLGQLHQMHRTF